MNKMIPNSMISQFFHGEIKMLILNLIKCLCLVGLVCFDLSIEDFRIDLFLSLIWINLDLAFVKFLFFLILLLIFFLIINLFHFVQLFYLYYLLLVLLLPVLFFIFLLFHCLISFCLTSFYQLSPKELVKQILINLFFIFVNFLNRSLNSLHCYFFFINNFCFFEND